MRPENRNVLWARTFVDELARLGVRDVCVASGSRSSPLVLALAERSAQGPLRLFPQVDERSAGFFALGAARASGRPSAVVTTSGTAAANLWPAVMEASQAAVPLLVLTADRPGHLRGQDANQTVDQLRLYGTYARLFMDVGPPRPREDLLRHLRASAGRAVAAAVGPPAGPVHLNFQFEKPLERTPVPGDVPDELAEEAPLAVTGRAAGAPFTRPHPAVSSLGPEASRWLAERAAAAARPLLVCGPAPRPDRLGPAALRLADLAGWPLLADPLSGARFGPGAGRLAVDGYDLLLRVPEARRALTPDFVLRLGGSPTSASLLEFLEGLTDAEQVVVDAGPRWADPLAVATHHVAADPAAACDALAERKAELGGQAPAPTWGATWARLSAAARQAADEELRERPFEGTVLADVARLAPAGGLLFVASSMPVRDLDAFGRPRDAPLTVVGLRGASGIDGSVSAALGAAAGAGVPALAVLGDLAFYHDMNGLLAARRIEADLTLVVIQNDGGGIFHFLPVREERAVFEPLVAMPHGLDFARAAELYGLPFRRLAGPAELEAALMEEGGAGVRIVEVPSHREENRRRHEQTAEAVRRGVREALAAGAVR